MIAMVALAVLLPTWAAAQVIQLCFVDRAARPGRAALVFGLALGVGLGATSCSYLAWLTLFGSAGWLYVACESLACLGLGLFARQQVRRNMPLQLAAMSAPETAMPAALRWLPAICGVALLLTGLALVLGYPDEPLGSSDAWCIWNHRARLLNRAQGDWHAHFTADAPHADYPLLTPGASARLWAYGGAETGWAPWLVESLFTAAMCAAVYGGVATATTRSMGCLALLALLSNVRIAQLTVTQYAETALQFYFVATTIAAGLTLVGSWRRGPGLLLAGLLAALSAWTKNEGLMFFYVATLAVMVANGWRSNWQMIATAGKFWFAGAATVLALVTVYKLSIDVDNDLVAGQSLVDTIQRLLSPSRWGTVLAGWATISATVLKAALVLLPAAALLLGRSKQTSDRRSAWLALSVVATMASGYTLVLVTTPNELHWHVHTSLDRLISQLFPVAVWGLACLLATPEELLNNRRQVVDDENQQAATTRTLTRRAA